MMDDLYMKRWKLSAEYHQAFESSKWMKEIPYIQFPSELKVKVIPPFAGAVVRFRVSDKDETASVSVYLDCYDQLGFFGEPYWEIYPHDGDVYRVAMNDVDELVQAIKWSVEQQLKSKEDNENNG